MSAVQLLVFSAAAALAAWWRRSSAPRGKDSTPSLSLNAFAVPQTALVPQPPSLRYLLVLDLDHTILARPINQLPHLSSIDQIEELPRSEAAALLIDAEALTVLQRACAVAGHPLRIGTHASDAVMVGVSQPREVEARIAALLRIVVGGGDMADSLHIFATKAADKCTHLAAAADAVRSELGVDFPPQRTVLIDDCLTNVEAARRAGYVALHCPRGLTREWLCNQHDLWCRLGLRYPDGSLPPTNTQ